MIDIEKIYKLEKEELELKLLDALQIIESSLEFKNEPQLQQFNYGRMRVLFMEFSKDYSLVDRIPLKQENDK